MNIGTPAALAALQKMQHTEHSEDKNGEKEGDNDLY
jgi:hypothetical protein